MNVTAIADSQPRRGTIIVDASSLRRMMVPLGKNMAVDQSRGEREGPCLSDMLFGLADLGYEIVVPSMVAAECGEFLPDGTSLNDAHHNSDPVYQLSKPFFNKIRTFKEVKAGGAGENIRITEPLDIPEARRVAPTVLGTLLKRANQQRRQYQDSHSSGRIPESQLRRYLLDLESDHEDPLSLGRLRQRVTAYVEEQHLLPADKILR